MNHNSIVSEKDRNQNTDGNVINYSFNDENFNRIYTNIDKDIIKTEIKITYDEEDKKFIIKDN